MYQDDFERSITGWSNNDADFSASVSNFLGRFAVGNTETSRAFVLPGNTEELRIEFDLYRFDSWDDFTQFGFDRFELEIDGVEVFSLAFPNPQDARTGSLGNVSWSHTPLTGREELGFTTGQFWFDQLHRFVVLVDNPGTSVEMTLRADLSQNDDVFLHNVILEDERMSFDSGAMEEGESLTVKFKKRGTFNVKCAIHTKMNLEVTVK